MKLTFLDHPFDIPIQCGDDSHINGIGTRRIRFRCQFYKKGIECQEISMITDSNQALFAKMSGCR